MSIKSYVDELEEIQHEIKRNNIKIVQLRQRIKELEANIKTYLNEKGQPGLKYKGKAIIIEEITSFKLEGFWFFLEKVMFFKILND